MSKGVSLLTFPYSLGHLHNTLISFSSYDTPTVHHITQTCHTLSSSPESHLPHPLHQHDITCMANCSNLWTLVGYATSLSPTIPCSTPVPPPPLPLDSPDLYVYKPSVSLYLPRIDIICYTQLRPLVSKFSSKSLIPLDILFSHYLLISTLSLISISNLCLSILHSPIILNLYSLSLDFILLTLLPLILSYLISPTSSPYC
jgi:hypothetical protein